MERPLVIGIVMVTLLSGCQQHQAQHTGTSRVAERKVVIAPTALPPALRVGRYVIVHNPHIEHETMLLDTATGRTWQLAEFPDLKGSPMGWEDVPRLDTLQDWETFVASHQKAEREADKRSAFFSGPSPGIKRRLPDPFPDH